MEGEFKFGKDHKKCATCGYCAHSHDENPGLLAQCEKMKAAGVTKGQTAMHPIAAELDKLIAILKKGPSPMTNSTFVPSLTPNSKTQYLPGQVRTTNPDAIKFQGEGSMEIEVHVDPKIANWLKDRKATLPSVAGTGVMYVPCRLVAHEKSDPKVAGFGGPVRVQIEGPALNRDFGAEFVVDHTKLRAWAEQFAAFIIAKGEGKTAILDPDEGTTQDDDPEEEKD